MAQSTFSPLSRSAATERKKTILAADDDSQLLMVYSRALGRAGYEVKAARDGREALEIFRNGGIDLLVSDYEMPHMNGRNLLREVRKIDPKAKVLIISGGRSQEEVAGLYAEGALKVLPKPITPDILLPAVSSALSFECAALKAEPEGIMRPVRVLLADDEAIMRMVCREACVHLGHDTLIAGCGAEALEQFRRGGVDVVVSDLHMPGISGLELMGALRAIEPGIPFILATAESRPEVLEGARASGVDAILEKPYSVDDLGRAIDDAVRNRKG